MLLRITVLLTVLGYAAAGCGTHGDGDPVVPPDAMQSPSQSTSPPMSSTDLPTMTPPTAPPTTPTDQLKPITVAGTIVREATEGCVQLVTDQNVRYTLRGDLSELDAGSTAKLRGMPAPQEESPCGGIVLDVRAVLPS